MDYTKVEFTLEFLELFHPSFEYCAEDITDVTFTIECDFSTNSFIGFTTSHVDGIPSSILFQADTFDEFKKICNSSELTLLLHILTHLLAYPNR
jgi:hypothetical protein